MNAERQGETDELPAPSPELVLIRVFVQAHLATAPRKQANAFLRHAAQLLENEESVALLLPIRPATHARELSQARKEAVFLFRQLLPALVASMTGA